MFIDSGESVKGDFLKIFFFLVVCFLMVLNFTDAISQYRKDILILKDSSIFIGKIIQHSPKRTVVFKTDDGKILKFNTDSVDYIAHEDDSEFNLKEHNYFDFGVTVGTPSAINMVLGRWFGSSGIKISGMFFGSHFLNGYQVEFCFRFADNKIWTHSASLVAGKFINFSYNIDEKEDYFLGLTYTINLNSVYFQGGLSTRPNYGYRIMPLFQIGYVYKFW